MSEEEINAQFEAADASGWEEVVSEEDVEVSRVELSAAIIDLAYRNLSLAYKKQHEGDIRLIMDDDTISPEEKESRMIETECFYRVKLAKNNVDRVTALANFMQIEAIFRSANQPE